MPAEIIGIGSALHSAANRLGPRVLYPGLPFFLVPLLVAGIIGSQFIGSLIYSHADHPAALDLPVSFSTSADELSHGATFLVIPNSNDDFYLGGMKGGISRIWLSMPADKLGANESRIELSSDGLALEPLRGVKYPLGVVVEGVLGDSIDTPLSQPNALRKLELTTPDSTWIVLSLLGSAVFGFGASTGFMKDRSVT